MSVCEFSPRHRRTCSVRCVRRQSISTHLSTQRAALKNLRQPLADLAAESWATPLFPSLPSSYLFTSLDCINGDCRALAEARACSGVFAGGETERSKAECAGRIPAEGQQPPPHQLGIRGSAESSQRGSGRSLDRPKVFHYFSTRMTSHDTIGLILLIVDYRAAIKGARPPCLLV